MQKEYYRADGGVKISLESTGVDQALLQPLTAHSCRNFLTLLLLLPLGVQHFSQEQLVDGDILYKDLLVETSCNLGVVSFRQSHVRLEPLARGSVKSVLDDLTARIIRLADLVGATAAIVSTTAGWEPPVTKSTLQTLFQHCTSTPWRVTGIHAGLECGYLVDAFAKAGKTLEAISIGPTIKAPHSPYEHLDVATVLPVWQSLLEVLHALAE